MGLPRLGRAALPCKQQVGKARRCHPGAASGRCLPGFQAGAQESTTGQRAGLETYARFGVVSIEGASNPEVGALAQGESVTGEQGAHHEALRP